MATKRVKLERFRLKVRGGVVCVQHTNEHWPDGQVWLSVSNTDLLTSASRHLTPTQARRIGEALLRFSEGRR